MAGSQPTQKVELHVAPVVDPLAVAPCVYEIGLEFWDCGLGHAEVDVHGWRFLDVPVQTRVARISWINAPVGLGRKRS